MLGYFTTDTLIADIKRRATIPDSQKMLNEADFLSFINTELKMGIVPSVLNVQEEYYVTPQVVPLVANKTKYTIPYRAIGGKLRDLFFQDQNGNLLEMSRISADDKSLYQQSNIGSPYLFYYIQGNDVVITPPIGTSVVGSLLFTFYMRPSDLVSEDRVAIISNITVDDILGTTTYTVDKIPTGMNTTKTLDLLQSKPGHKIRNFDIYANAVITTNKTITFSTSDVDSETEIGDMVSFAGECIIPQCPTDLQPMLAQRVTARCLEALGDTQGLTNANTKIQEMETKSFPMIDSRVTGSPQKIVNSRGLLRRSRSRYRNRGIY